MGFRSSLVLNQKASDPVIFVLYLDNFVNIIRHSLFVIHYSLLKRNSRGGGNELFQTKIGENGFHFFVIRGIVSRGGLVRKPGEHQRERLLFNFRGWYDPYKLCLRTPKNYS